MNKWCEEKLGNIATLEYGKSLPERCRDAGDYPVYGSGGVVGTHNKPFIKTEGIIIGRKGSIGTVYYAKKPFFPIDTVFFIDKINKGYHLKFYYYFLGNIGLNTLNSDAAVPGLNRNWVHCLKAKIPRFEIQEKIAAILSAYDDLIENNKRRIELLEKMAEEIYREWFVRMRFPGYEKVKFEKGLPRVWEKKRFGNFCLLKRGYDLPDSKVEPGEYPVIASTSIKTFHNQYKVNPPVITTGRSGTLGEVLYTPRQAWPLNTTLYVKDFLGNSPYFIYYTLKNMGLENFNSGAGVPTLNRNHINCIFIAVPSTSLQKEFNAKLSTCYQNKEAIESSIGILEKSKELLLARLISGKLSVESLDIQFPPSMQEQQDVAHA